MGSKQDSLNSNPIIEARILFEIAKELDWLAVQAKERARAAFARIELPLPLFDRGGQDDR